MKSQPALESANQDTLTIATHLTKRYVTRPAGDLRQTGGKYICDNLVPGTDLTLYSGQGGVLETNHGKLYDFGSMSHNCILGQNDPWVNANLVSYILSGSPSYATTSAATDLYYEIAEKISKLSGIKDAVVDHKQCNGSDVTELAIVAAYKHKKPGQRYVVSFKGSYHGQNLTSFTVSDLQAENRFYVDEEVATVFLDTPTHTQPGDNKDELSANDEHILEELKKVGQYAFAVIIEPIQVNNRVNICSKLFLRELKAVCEELGVPLIFDDIQTGYGWLGTFSSVDYFGVTPNMMAIGKALTAGYGPLAALVVDPQYRDLPDTVVRKTNGADARSLVAAKAVIERMAGADESLIPDDIDDTLKQELKDGLLASFSQKETAIETRLTALKNKFPNLLGEIRGAGLIWCVEVIDADGQRDVQKCSEIQKAILEKGVLLRNLRGTLLFKMPIVFTEQELDEGFGIVSDYLASL